VEDELITQALDAFKQRAELVRKQLSAKSYRIVDIAINGGGPQPMPQMRGYSMAKADIAAPALEAGSSSVSVNVSGVIELE
jgi:predicted secreted protein